MRFANPYREDAVLIDIAAAKVLLERIEGGVPKAQE